MSIASKLESSSDFSDPKGWPKLATFLETPTTLRKQYEKDLLLNLKGGMDVFHGLLIEWRARRSKDATLTKLLEGLETCGWTDIAGNYNLLQISPKKNIVNSLKNYATLKSPKFSSR